MTPINTAPTPLRIFIGFDPRQPLAYNVLQYSLLGNSSAPLAITPLVLRTLPIKRVGLTEFTYTRYLVPWLCNYTGFALFLDADIVCNADIAELFQCATYEHGVMVAANKPGFERPAVMLFNNARCTALTPSFIEHGAPQDLERWAGSVGEFPSEWAYCVGYNHDDTPPKMVHYTGGIPIWPETQDSKFADIWHAYHAGLNASVGYNDLMRNSVHHKRIVAGEHRS